MVNQKAILKAQLPMGPIICYQTMRLVTRWTDGVWLQVVWKIRPRVLLRKQTILVLEAFKVHLTLDITPKFMQWILT
jgi:hypothetical protein